MLFPQECTICIKNSEKKVRTLHTIFDDGQFYNFIKSFIILLILNWLKKILVNPILNVYI